MNFLLKSTYIMVVYKVMRLISKFNLITASVVFFSSRSKIVENGSIRNVSWRFLGLQYPIVGESIFVISHSSSFALNGLKFKTFNSTTGKKLFRKDHSGDAYKKYYIYRSKICVLILTFQKLNDRDLNYSVVFVSKIFAKTFLIFENFFFI